MDKNKEGENNSKNTISIFSNEPKELNSVEKILITVIRRKKIFFLTLISFFVFGYIRTAKEVVFNSIYQGNFTLLISDPIDQKASSGGIGAKGVNKVIDLNTKFEQDLPT